MLEQGTSASTIDDPPIHVRDRNIHTIDLVTQSRPSMQQVTSHSPRASGTDSDKFSQLFSLTNFIIEEYKNTASLPDLDTAIYLFHEALDQRPAPYPLRTESLKNLVWALVTRFNMTNEFQDMTQTIALWEEALKKWYGIFTRAEGNSPVRVCPILL
jgi:hypothetical protein